MSPDTSPLDRAEDSRMRQAADEEFNSFLDSWLANDAPTFVHQDSNVSSTPGHSQDALCSQQLPQDGLRNPFEKRSSTSTNPTSSGDVPFAMAYPAEVAIASAPAPRGKGGVTVKPTSLKHAKVLEKNRRAQARFREKQKQKEKDMEMQLQALQQQLQAAHLETTGFKRQNEVLNKILELRQNSIEVLTDAANLQTAGTASSTITSPAAPQVGTFSVAAAPVPPIPDLETLKAMTARSAAARWRDYVQHMATLLLECETPSPAPGAVERLETHAVLTGTFLQRLAVVNPSVAKAIAHYNLDTLEPFDECNLRPEVFRQPFWQQKVESLMLSQEQKEQVAILMRHHQAALAALEAEAMPFFNELKQLLPNTIGIDKKIGIKGCVRTSELISLVRKNFHQKHQAWFTLAATILGKLLTRMQFARFCVNSYPYIPIVRAITSSVTDLPVQPVSFPVLADDTKPSPILTA